MENNQHSENRKDITPCPVFLHHTTSLNPGQVVESYPAVGQTPFEFFNPDRPVFYSVHGLVFGVVR